MQEQLLQNLIDEVRETNQSQMETERHTRNSRRHLLEMKKDLVAGFDGMVSAISGIKVAPQIQVDQPEVELPEQEEQSEDETPTFFADLIGAVKSLGKREKSPEEINEDKARSERLLAGIQGIGTKFGEGFKSLGQKFTESAGGALGNFRKILLLGAVGALIFSLKDLLQDPRVIKIKDTIVDIVAPAIVNIFDALVSLGDNLLNFAADPSWENLKTVLTENGLALAGVVAFLAPKTTFTVLKGAASGLMAGFKLLPGLIAPITSFFTATIVPAISTGLASIGTFFSASLMPFLSTLGSIFSSIALPLTAALAVGYSLFEGFSAFNSTLEETGSFGEALKQGVSTFLGTLLALPATLSVMLMDGILGLTEFLSFGLLDFTEIRTKLGELDFAGDMTKFISDGINDIIEFITQFIPSLDDIKDMLPELPDLSGLNPFGDSEADSPEFRRANLQEEISLLEQEKEDAKPESEQGIMDSFSRSKEDIQKEIDLKNAQLKEIEQRYKGGQVMQGEPYLVGELGPELFVPQSSGQIVRSRRTMDMMQTSMDNAMSRGSQTQAAPVVISAPNNASVTNKTSNVSSVSVVNGDFAFRRLSTYDF